MWLVTEEVSAKVAGLEGEGRLGRSCRSVQCACGEVVNPGVRRGWERGRLGAGISRSLFFFCIFVFNLSLPRYTLEGALEINEDTVTTSLKSCGTMSHFSGQGCRSGVLRARLGFG